MRLDARRFRCLILAIGGVAFVAFSSGGLPAPLLWRILGGALAVGVVTAAIASTAPPPPPPRPGAGRVYGISVLLMVVAIVLGARVLSSLDRPDLVRLWVVLVVGQHFVPFATAFREPLFARLGWSMVALAVLGVVLVPLGDAVPYAGAVAAGLVMLGFAVWGLIAPGPSREPEVGSSLSE